MDELNEITQHLLRFSPDALIVVDDRAQICFANETVTQLFGYPPELLIGRSIETLIPSRVRGRHDQYTSAYMHAPSNRDMGARIAELFALRADGTEFPAGIRLAPFRIGEKLFVAAAVRDGTERARVNAELIAAREEAIRANRAKSRFLATASHDLRQPLQTIRLLNAAMLKVGPKPEAPELLQQQGQAIESMTRLLNALLDISRLESGSIEPVSHSVALADVFHELESEFTSIARSRDISLVFDRPSLVLSTDRTLLLQLLQNLLANALKYTDHGAVTMRCEYDENGACVIVSDTGVGIPADKLERIFDEYYQVDTHGAKRMGVGLGLAIVKEAARILGLTVSITSSIGEGTIARVRIPQKLLLASASSGALPESVPLVATQTYQPRLFLVEDNDGVRMATELFLKLEGHETVSAASIVEARELFVQLERGDIVIADYHLDLKNTGLEMLLALREERGYEVPGVILSGDLQSVLRTIKSPVPGCRFLSKPVDTVALLDAIRELSTRSWD
jgi:two-component system, sensor histidine kinase